MEILFEEKHVLLNKYDLINSSKNKCLDEITIHDFYISSDVIKDANIIQYNFVTPDNVWGQKYLKDRFGIFNQKPILIDENIDENSVDGEISEKILKRKWEELCHYAFDKNLTVNKSNCIVINSVLLLTVTGDVFAPNGDVTCKLNKNKITYEDMKTIINILTD